MLHYDAAHSGAGRQMATPICGQCFQTMNVRPQPFRLQPIGCCCCDGAHMPRHDTAARPLARPRASSALPATGVWLAARACVHMRA